MPSPNPVEFVLWPKKVSSLEASSSCVVADMKFVGAAALALAVASSVVELASSLSLDSESDSEPESSESELELLSLSSTSCCRSAGSAGVLLEGCS